MALTSSCVCRRRTSGTFSAARTGAPIAKTSADAKTRGQEDFGMSLLFGMSPGQTGCATDRLRARVVRGGSVDGGHFRAHGPQVARELAAMVNRVEEDAPEHVAQSRLPRDVPVDQES